MKIWIVKISASIITIEGNVNNVSGTAQVKAYSSTEAEGSALSIAEDKWPSDWGYFNHKAEVQN